MAARRPSPRLRKLAVPAAWAALAGFALLLALHLQAILADAPMEMRDGAAVATTVALLEGRNPYALPGIATSGNLYGILYPVSVLPFAWAFGPGFLAHHLATAAAIWSACGLVWWRLRASGVGRLDALLGTGLIYAGLVYFTGAAARADGLGVLLMLAALIVMERGGFSTRAFAAGLGLSLLAMLAKIYFVWPAFAVATYVFLCRDLRRGLAYGIAAILATAAAWALIGLLAPGYVAVVLMASIGATSYDAGHLVRQVAEWSLFSLPLLAAGVLALPGRRRVRDPGAWAVMFGLGWLAIIGTLGGHKGAHLSYLFQLLTPFLVVAALTAARDRPSAMLAFRLLLPVAILLNAHRFLPVPPVSAADCALSMRAPEAEIARGARVLATAELAGQLALAGRSGAETGHSEYFNDALGPRPGWLLPFLPPQPAMTAEWQGLVERIRADVAARRYDVVYVGAHPSVLIPRDLIAEHYARDPPRCPSLDAVQSGDEPPLPGAVMPWSRQAWPFEVWRPRR
jgi:hypothetical protein